mmetsp:Transcript_59236/g.158514  ORF Transcript_59236/g.158514 Transcript_59236/m.158514 type:complete len:264 (-) Transcript_59236:920-1711(-)
MAAVLQRTGRGDGPRGPRSRRSGESSKKEVQLADGGCRVWVGGIDNGPRADALPVFQAKAATYGTIQVIEAGFPGFVFVVYEDAFSAAKAAEGLNNVEVTEEVKINASLATKPGYDKSVSRHGRGTPLEQPKKVAPAVPKLAPWLRRKAVNEEKVVAADLDSPRSTATGVSAPESSVVSDTTASEVAKPLTPEARRQMLGDRLYAVVLKRLQSLAPVIVSDLLNAYKGELESLEELAELLATNPALLKSVLRAAVAEQLNPEQ